MTAPQEIAGYRLESKLGEGGMGAVFRATHPRFPGQTFALKVLLGDGKPDPEAAARFQREMQALRAASAHPNVVRVYGGAIEGNRPYILMELVEGESLHKLARGKGLEAKRALLIVRDVCDAIGYVHREGILHRDLKPENIVVEASGRPRVCDFGLARVMETERLTRSGAIFGTPSFSAPEQIDGRAREADARADVYALGAVLFFALTGRAPFEASTEGALLKRVLFERPPRVGRFMIAGASDDLDAICWKALEKEPAARYATALALREDLDRVLAGEGVSAQIPGLGRRLAERLGRVRREGSVVLVGAVVALLAGAVTIGTVRSQRERAIGEAYAEALEPGRSVAEIQERLTILEARGADAAWVATVLRRREERDLEETALVFANTPAEKVSPRELDALVQKAIGAIESACLVGEGGGFAIGETLLTRRDAARDAAATDPALEKAALEDSGKLLAAAASLATKRLLVKPLDAAGCALRAQVTLARIGAPRDALGRGRLGLEAATSSEMQADLRAAASLPGPPGERAAWLLVDLLVCGGSERLALARAALEAAVQRAPGAPARAILESVVAAPDAPELVWERLVPALGDPARARDAALELSRFFARLDLPDVLEHPELAVKSDAGAIARALAADGEERFAFLEDSSRALEGAVRAERDGLVREIEGLVRSIHGAWQLDHNAETGKKEDIFDTADRSQAHADLERIRAVNGPRAAARLVRGFELSPRDRELLHWGGDAIRGGLTSSVCMVLLSRLSGSGSSELWFAFTRDLRALTRNEKNWHEFPEADWEDPPELSPLRACLDFDRRLDASVAAEKLPLAARSAGVQRDIELAVRAVKGLRRMEALELPEAHVMAKDESRLVLQALFGLEAGRKLGGPGLLPFRSRLRRIAFPGTTGEALGHLDLERLRRLPGSSDGLEDNARLLFVGAAAALRLPGARGESAAAIDDARRLYALGIAWAHEHAVAEALSPSSGAHPVWKLTSNLQDRRSEMSPVGGFRVIGTDLVPEPRIALDLAPSGEDEARLRAGKYEPLDPRVRTRRGASGPR